MPSDRRQHALIFLLLAIDFISLFSCQASQRLPWQYLLLTTISHCISLESDRGLAFLELRLSDSDHFSFLFLLLLLILIWQIVIVLGWWRLVTTNLLQISHVRGSIIAVLNFSAILQTGSRLEKEWLLSFRFLLRPCHQRILLLTLLLQLAEG